MAPTFDEHTVPYGTVCLFMIALVCSGSNSFWFSKLGPHVSNKCSNQYLETNTFRVCITNGLKF